MVIMHTCVLHAKVMFRGHHAETHHAETHHLSRQQRAAGGGAGTVLGVGGDQGCLQATRSDNYVEVQIVPGDQRRSCT